MPCEAKNWKSGCVTWRRLNQLSAACMRELARWHSLIPCSVHINPLNLYEAIPNAVRENLGLPSISLGKTILGAWVFPLPIRKRVDFIVCRQWKILAWWFKYCIHQKTQVVTTMIHLTSSCEVNNTWKQENNAGEKETYTSEIWRDINQATRLSKRVLS